MSKYLQKKFALSEQGGRDLTKAIFSCAFTNMGLIFPMGENTIFCLNKLKFLPVFLSITYLMCIFASVLGNLINE